MKDDNAGNKARRTDELLRNGARRIGGQRANAPFVRWPDGDEYAFVEGELLEIWEGHHGPVGRLRVTDASDNLLAVSGKESVAVCGPCHRQIRCPASRRLRREWRTGPD